MNKTQAQNVKGYINQVASLDIDDFVNRMFPDRQDLENIELGQMTLDEFVYLSKRVIKQFEAEFENRDSTLVLPYQFNYLQQGLIGLDGQLQTFISYINGNNIVGAEASLLWLVTYQVEHGFYNKTIKKANDITANNLNKLSERLNLIETNILNKLADVERLFNELEEAKREITNLINQKREELSQITLNLSTTNTHAAQINELLTKGTDQSSRLTTLLEQQEQNKQSADVKLQQLQELYSSTNEKLNENVKVIQGLIEEFKTQVTTNEGHVQFIEGKKEFFEERINYLEDLIGREVGASLFETFKQRKNELESPVRFWRWVVPIMSIATVIWVFIIFKNQSQILDINLWWQAFALNTLKTAPAIFLLLFAITQYKNERNFQEEYAFKSAVALTIKAYANQLETPSNKDALIMEAVLGVYKTPIESSNSSKVKNKTMDTIKTLVDTTSELVKGKA